MRNTPDHANLTVVADRQAETAAPLDAYLRQDASTVLYRWGSLLSDALIRVRRQFDGDMDQYLLLLVFQLNQLSRASAHGEAPAPVRGMNALSLSDITHIPRETTRRKLQALEGQGYIARGTDGLYYLAERYGVDAFFFDLKPLFWDAVLLSHGAETPAPR